MTCFCMVGLVPALGPSLYCWLFRGCVIGTVILFTMIPCFRVCVCKIWAKDPSESMIIRRLLTAVRYACSMCAGAV